MASAICAMRWAAACPGNDRYPAGRVASPRWRWLSSSIASRRWVVWKNSRVLLPAVSWWAVAVQDETLTLSWLQNGERHWHGADLPADLCRDGLPMQRQALGELCADLLLDCGLSPAAVDLELLLPLQACQWISTPRLLGGGNDGSDGPPVTLTLNNDP